MMQQIRKILRRSGIQLSKYLVALENFGCFATNFEQEVFLKSNFHKIFENL